MTLEASTLKIITHPKDDTVSIDETGYVSYQVEASGGKMPYTYLWQRRTADTDWSDLSKTPRSAVEQTINNVDAQVLRISPGAFSSLAERGYAFRCVVTDADGNSVTSNSAAFFVKTEELRITMQPMSVPAAGLLTGISGRFPTIRWAGPGSIRFRTPPCITMMQKGCCRWRSPAMSGGIMSGIAASFLTRTEGASRRRR